MSPLRFLRRRFVPPIRRAIIRGHRRRGSLLISDTTLRDGEQMPGATLDPDDKVAIARELAAIGVHSIDAGFAAASRQDTDAIRRIAAAVDGPVITSLARTLPSDIDAADAALEGLPLQRRGVSLFIGTSPIHRRHKLGKSRSETLKLAIDAVRHAAERFSVVSLAAEDSSRTEPDFLAELAREAIAAGISSLGLPDTVGVQTPEQVREQLRRLQDDVPQLGSVMLAVHTHNDLGLAVANALAAIEEGATIVQGTFGGIGERAGNLPLEELLLAVATHPEQYGPLEGIDLTRLRPACRLIAERTGLPIAGHKPVVGRNVFATAAGIHQDGLLKNPETYLPYPMDWLGVDEIEMVLGRHSGAAAVAHRLQAIGCDNDDAVVRGVLDRIKSLPKSEHATDDQLRDWSEAIARTSAATSSAE